MLQKNSSRDIGRRGDSGKQIVRPARNKNNGGQDPRSKKDDGLGNNQLRRGNGGNLRDRGIRELQ